MSRLIHSRSFGRQQLHMFVAVGAVMLNLYQTQANAAQSDEGQIEATQDNDDPAAQALEIPTDPILSDDDFDAQLQSFDDFGVEWPEFDNPQDEAPENSDTVIGQNHADIQPEANASDSDQSLAASDALQDAPLPVEDNVSGLADNAQRTIIDNYKIALTFEDVTLSEQDREGLFGRFDALSSLEALSNKDSNIAQLRRRADRDRDVLLRLLRIYGHYDAIVQPRFANTDRDIAAPANAPALASRDDDVQVEFVVNAGPLYNLNVINLGDLQQTGADFGYFRDVFAITNGDPVNSDDIVAGRDRLITALTENGYAFAQISDPELVIDHQARAGALSLPVDPGAKYRFGTINVGDDPLLSARHLLRIARFDSGDVFRGSRVEDLRRAILATGLASSVTIERVASNNAPSIAEDKPPRAGIAGDKTPAAAPETLDLNIDIAPAPLRTIAGEIGFGTGQGFRVAASWEHRNFFPPEGLLRVRGVLGTQEQLLGATYRRNNFRQRDTVLNINALIANIQFDAFNARTISLSGNVQRQTNLIFQKKWTWSAGTEFVLTDERDISGPNTIGRQTFGIAALPVSLAYDGSDDLLNPVTGFRLAALASPEISLISGNVAYLRAQVDGSFYQPFSDNVVLAGRVRFAGTTGAQTLSIAPSRRFYAGGGGSVRGFGFQDIGPLDVNGDPVGGRSLAEFSLEARVRFGDFGVVPFVDAGNVYSSSLPGLDVLRYGAGIGLRYYSSFGPLRLDIGTPINPRENDTIITVFVSLGQAF